MISSLNQATTAVTTQRSTPSAAEPAAPLSKRATSIEKRSEDVSERNTLGHREMDFVIGKKETHKTLLVLTYSYEKNKFALNLFSTIFFSIYY